MSKNNRRFSIGYNGDNVEAFNAALNPYMDKIESVFFGYEDIYRSHYMPRHEHSEDFLKYKAPYKKIITLNNLDVPMLDAAKYNKLLHKIYNLVESGYIQGVITTSYGTALTLHRRYPNLELHTSCNCLQYNLREMAIWQENCGITYFNAPRDILRLKGLLKEMHDAGFKLKCLVNESCLIGCPTTIYHLGDMVLDRNNYERQKKQSVEVGGCLKGDKANFFRSVWILPRWMDALDEYVDLYKLTTRNFTTEKLAYALDVYINQQNEFNLLDVLNAGTIKKTREFLGEGAYLSPKDIPDILSECECRNCYKGCTVCSELAKKIFG